MKVYTKVVMDLDGNILEENSFEYKGPIALCKGGGGGGSSGRVEYPTYMQTAHGNWLDGGGADTMTSSIVDLMNAALSNSPFSGETAFDPATDTADMITTAEAFETLVGTLDSGTGLPALITGLLSDTRIDAAVDAFGDDLSSRITTEVYPRFEGGMRDINAVMSSAFVIGKANIENQRLREVAKFSADMRARARMDDAIRVVGLRLEYEKAVAQIMIEARRIKIVAQKEEVDKNLIIDEADAKWDMEVYQYGANVLASISGGTDSPSLTKRNPTVSAIGGALSGAASGAMAGSMIMPGYGTAIGAIAGAALGIGAAMME
jgi:hypothetical protein